MPYDISFATSSANASYNIELRVIDISDLKKSIKEVLCLYICWITC